MDNFHLIFICHILCWVITLCSLLSTDTLQLNSTNIRAKDSTTTLNSSTTQRKTASTFTLEKNFISNVEKDSTSTPTIPANYQSKNITSTVNYALTWEKESTSTTAILANYQLRNISSTVNYASMLEKESTSIPDRDSWSSMPNTPHTDQSSHTSSVMADSTSSTVFTVDTSTSIEGSLSTEFPTKECEDALPGCRCFDYDVVAGVQCPSIDAFSARRLEAAFEANTTFEVTLEGGGILRRRILDGLIVFRLFLDGVGGVEEGAFEGVLRLRRFHARLSTLTEVPDFRPIRDSLRNIHLDNGQLTSVDGVGLTNLPLLNTLSMVNNSIFSVDTMAFEGTENIMIFDLSRNLLSTLPPDLFDRWTKLNKVVLSRNRLLHADRLFAITHPRFIYLDSNQLTDLDSIFHPNMTAVETVQLSHNPLGRVSTASFNGRIVSTRFLYLDHCDISIFDSTHYADLSQLATLDLSHNLIGEVTPQSIDFGYNLELDLTGNRITEFNADLPFNVRRVFLTGNLLSSVGRTLQYSQMTEVALADNLIRWVAAADFVGAHGFQVLELQGNRIEGVEKGSLDPIRRDLVHLDLSRNRLRSLGGCVRYLSALTSLNLTDNMLESFGEDEFIGLNELSELYLGHNRISTLSAQLQLLPQLQYLVVSHNRISTISPDQIPSKLRYLYFEGNPFKCNCELLPFLVHLNSSSGPGTDVPLCLPTYNGMAQCPRPCSCACSTLTYGEHYMQVDCMNKNLSEVPMVFPNATAEDPRLLSISLQRSSTEWGSFVLHDEVGALDLSNNRLSEVDEAHFPKSLRILRLETNFLTSPFLPTSLHLLQAISLADNPWICDCDALPFKKWILSKSEIVEDYNTTACGPGEMVGRVIWTLMDMDLCPTDVGFYVSLAFGILSVCLLVAGGKIAWTRWGVNVRVWLYSKGVTWAKERDVDMEKRFDAFLSFSHKDAAFVCEHIVDVIEKRAPNVRLCLHYKHFLPGEFIHDNILNAVHNSKRTVLVLSKNFLESEWCLLEFRAAHVQALRDRVHRVVVIKVGELPDDLMDPTLRLYMKSTTYMTWGEGNFWDNLLYVLPTSTAQQPTQVTLDIIKSHDNK